MNHVATAAALKELNMLSERDGTDAAIAYLTGQYGDMRDFFESLHRFLDDCKGDPANADAIAAFDYVNGEAQEFMAKCDALEGV